MSKKYILNVALTGAVLQKSDNPNLPITEGEIIQDALEVIEEGASMIHLHVRDENNQNTLDPVRYGNVIETLRAEHPDVIYVVSCSGRFQPDYEHRKVPLFLEGTQKPDMASLTLSSLNFMQSASINAPSTVQQLAKTMQDRGIKPELEVFDIGMINYSKYLIKKGLLTPPYYYNVLLGNIAGLQPTPADISAVCSALPPDSIVSFGGLGTYQLYSNVMGLMYMDGVRVGLEDNVYMERGVYATNLGQVKRMKEIATNLGMELMSPVELRERLGLSR